MTTATVNRVVTHVTQQSIVTVTSRIIRTSTPFLQPTLAIYDNSLDTFVTQANCIIRQDWEVSYIIQLNDTLSYIALASGTTTNDIMRANCLANADNIYIGQVIRLPSSPNFGYTPTYTVTATSHIVTTPIPSLTTPTPTVSITPVPTRERFTAIPFDDGQ